MPTTIGVLRSTNTTGLPTTGATLTEWPIRDITTTTAAGATSALSIAVSTTEIGYGYGPANSPGVAGVSAAGWTVEVNVTTANTNIFLAIQIHRVNSAGTVQASSTTTAEQNTTAGIKTFSVDGSALGVWGATDRVRVDYRFRNSSTMTAGGPTLTLNTTDNEVIMPDVVVDPIVVFPTQAFDYV